MSRTDYCLGHWEPEGEARWTRLLQQGWREERVSGRHPDVEFTVGFEEQWANGQLLWKLWMQLLGVASFLILLSRAPSLGLLNVPYFQTSCCERAGRSSIFCNCAQDIWYCFSFFMIFLFQLQEVLVGVSCFTITTTLWSLLKTG